MVTMSETTHIKVTRDTHERLEWYKTITDGVDTFDKLINHLMNKLGMGSIEVIRTTKRNFGKDADAAPVGVEAS